MSGQGSFRLPPALAAHEYVTYAVASPVETHTRPASCVEVDCTAYGFGWRTTLDVSTELGARQAQYIRLHSGRKFTTSAGESENLVVFTFPAFQQCFAEHRVTLDRPAFFVRRDGDWRGNPRGTQPLRMSADNWVDDFATHQARLRTTIERG